MTTKSKTPQIRFKEFSDVWEEKKLKEISTKITEKNVFLEYSETFTNSAQYGIISQRDYFNKDISNSENIGGYYIIKDQDFVYNPRISSFAPFGPINRNKLGRTGVMSPLYTAFRTYDIDNIFLEQFFKSNYWHNFMGLNGDTGARSDRFSIKDSIFIEMPISYPKIAEQTKIGDYFQHLDKLIEQKEQKYQKLRQFKIAMLDKMFPKNGTATPEIRFKGFSGEWEESSLGHKVEFFTGLTYSPKDVLKDRGTLVLRSSNVKNGKIVDADNVYVNPDVVNCYNVQKGDIAVVVRNGSRSLIGKHAQIQNEMNNTVIGAFMTGIRSEQSSYINALLDTQKFTIEVEKNLGATINQITTGAFKKMIFSFPTLTEQTKIGNYFHKLDKLINLHLQELEKLRNIKKASLEKMFV